MIRSKLFVDFLCQEQLVNLDECFFKGSLVVSRLEVAAVLQNFDKVVLNPESNLVSTMAVENAKQLDVGAKLCVFADV